MLTCKRKSGLLRLITSPVYECFEILNTSKQVLSGVPFPQTTSDFGEATI